MPSWLRKMSPSLPVDDAPDRVIGDTVLAGERSLIAATRDALTDLTNDDLRQNRATLFLAAAGSRYAEASAVRMKRVAAMRYPLKVFESVVIALPVDVVHLPSDGFIGDAKECASHQPMDPLKRNLAVLAEDDLKVAVARDELSHAPSAAALEAKRAHDAPAVRDGIGGFVTNYRKPAFSFHGLQLKAIERKCQAG